MIRHLIQSHRGFSLVGMLVTMVCMVVLFVILMNSLNKAVTGQGSQQQGTVRSTQDELYLYSLYQSMAVFSNDNKGLYPVPSIMSGSKKTEDDTTANLYSAMVMQHLAEPKQLISGNEYSGYVEEMMNYDFNAYNPTKKVFWDTNFKADLSRLSNVSFAHEPLCGKRFDNEWNNRMSSTFPLVGNRGPKDGVNSVNSWACGKNGIWGGHLAFGDGHIIFTHDPAGNGITYEQEGRHVPDNLFIMETGGQGIDAILSFTKSMSKTGPELQWD